jgi:hypothetical protein
MRSTTQYKLDNKVEICSTCKIEKPWSEFDTSKSRRPFGLTSNCSDCERIRKRASSARWRANNPKTATQDRARNLKQKFGISPEEYDQLSEAQDHKCAICDLPESDIHHKTGKPQRLAVDHDHTSGKIRGLLCAKCNKAIGLLKDNPDLLRSAAQYLDRE